MMKNLLAIMITMALTGGATQVYAAGSVSAGKSKAASCTSCHGDKGNSMMPMFPKLAGQHEVYIANQLSAFKEGERKGPTMAPMALSLSEQDMADLGAYYAAQRISANSMPDPQNDDDDDDDEDESEAIDIKAVMTAGKNLYRNGNLETKVAACIACHGPSGEGNKPAGFPALRSQHADYLIKSLQEFKTGKRNKNPENTMHMIAKQMTEDEIKAVSYHISMLK